MVRTALVHIRQQWAGLLALFLVLAGGTAYAAGHVSSADIVNGQVKTADLGRGAVKAKNVANGAIDSRRIKDQSVASADVLDNSLTGADIDESTLSGLGAGGPAGGDLIGTYPNPTIKPNAVGGSQVADGSLTGADIASHTIGQADIDGTDHYGALGVGGVSSGRCTTVTVSISGAEAGDAGILTTDGTLPDGQVMYLQRVLANTGQVKVCNLSGGDLPAITVNVRILTFH